MTMLSNQTASSPIASLNYFAAVIDEVIEQSNTSETYWAYIRRQMMALERQWVTCIRGKTSSSVG